MTAMLKNAWGYQGNNLDLPVKDLDTAVPFYERVMGFRVEHRNDVAPRSAVLERDGIRIGLAENGRDPEQDGCAFHVESVEALFSEFSSGGLGKEPEFTIEERDDGSQWKVFFVVAPDGLCYWFGEQTRAPNDDISLVSELS